MTCVSPVLREAPVSPPKPQGYQRGGDEQEKFVAPVEGENDDQEPEGDEELEDEVQPLRVHRDPMQPSREEAEAHRRTHLPYRAWCRFCVMGRGIGAPHFAMAHECKVPIISIDYFFVTSGGLKIRSELEYLDGPEGDEQLEQDRRQGKILKCIILKWKHSKAVFAHAVPCKGRD